MIPIIKWTVWQRRISTIWWSLGVFGFIFLNMIFYPTFRDQADQLQKTFQDLPPAALQLFGGSADFFSPVGFLNSQIFFLMLPLLLGVLAIGLGTSLVGREEQDMTIESLLARPVSRSKFLAAKAIAGGIVLSIITLVSMLTTVIIGKLVDLAVPASYMAEATLACFVLVLSFGAIAFLLTTIGRARSASMGIAAFIAIGGYLVSSLAGTVDWLKLPAKFFPFHYYRPESILRGTFQWSYILIMLAVTLVCGLLAWLAFRRRDIA